MMEKVKMGPQTLLFPMPAVLVGTHVNQTPNFMTAAWCGIAASSPPALTVAVRRARFTFEGITAHGTFSINVPSADLVKKVDYCGIYSGRKKDKSAVFEVEYGLLDTAPLVRECPVNLECKVIQSVDLKSHTLFIGEIVESHVRADCLTNGQPDPRKIDPLIYGTGAQQYLRLGEVIADAFRIGKES
ncbi:MAG: flavin reductase family protein [Desulfobacterales bacterium]|nr:MAG: flavin reductase family protein [Desulfobacterales bacterium]